MLVLISVIGVFAGCGKTPDVEVPVDTASPFAIYRKEDGQIIRLGDKRENVEKILGPDELFVAEFEEDNTERVQYHDNMEILVDYMADGSICAIRFSTDKWKLFNDITIGMKADDVKKNYPDGYTHKYIQTDDLWMSYDESGNAIKFSEDAPYIIRFDFEDGKTINQIVIQDNSF